MRVSKLAIAPYKLSEAMDTYVTMTSSDIFVNVGLRRLPRCRRKWCLTRSVSTFLVCRARTDFASLQLFGKPLIDFNTIQVTLERGSSPVGSLQT